MSFDKKTLKKCLSAVYTPETDPTHEEKDLASSLTTKSIQESMRRLEQEADELKEVAQGHKQPLRQVISDLVERMVR